MIINQLHPLSTFCWCWTWRCSLNCTCTGRKWYQGISLIMFWDDKVGASGNVQEPCRTIKCPQSHGLWAMGCKHCGWSVVLLQHRGWAALALGFSNLWAQDGVELSLIPALQLESDHMEPPICECARERQVQACGWQRIYKWWSRSWAGKWAHVSDGLCHAGPSCLCHHCAVSFGATQSPLSLAACPCWIAKRHGL